MANNIDVIGLANYVQGQGELGRQQGERQLTRRLAGQVIGSGDPAALNQLAAIDPQAAASAQEFNDGTLRRVKGMIQFFEDTDAKDPAAAQALWQSQGVPFVRQFANGTEPTADWNQAKPMLQGLKAKIAGMEAAQGGRDNLPAGYQAAHMQAIAAGYQPGSPEYQRAMRIQLGTEAGLARTQPRTLTVDIGGVPTQVTFNPATQQYTTARVDGGPAQMASGEVPFSVDPTLPPDVQAAIRANPQGAGAIPDGGTLPVGPQTAQAPAGASGTPIIGRTKEAEAAAVRDAQNRSDLTYSPQITAGNEQARADVAAGNFPRMTDLEADRARATEAAKVAGEKQGEAAAALPQVLAVADQTDGLLTKAINHPGRAGFTGLNAWLDPRGLVPGTPERDFSVLLDQIKGKAFLQAFNDLRGGGAITEREGTAATNAIARLNNAQSDAAFVEALRELQGITRAARARAQAKAAGGGQATPAPQESSGAPRRLRYNPATGRIE